ncbi:MAG: hypothetical protein ACLRXQ_08690 [Phascolarctobacterium faecium]
MHAIEKLLAEKAGKHQVATGEIVNCDVDIAGINDLYLQLYVPFMKWAVKRFLTLIRS